MLYNIFKRFCRTTDIKADISIKEREIQMNKDFDKDDEKKISSDYDVEKIIAEVNEASAAEKEVYSNALNAEASPQSRTIEIADRKSKDDIINQINQSLGNIKTDKPRSDYDESYSKQNNSKKNYYSHNEAIGLQKEIERGTRYNELKSMKVNSHRGRNAVLFVLGLVVILLIGAYIVGFMMTKDSFLPNTFVNGTSVGGMNISEAAEAVHSGAAVNKLVLKKLNGETVTIDYSKIDYTYSTADELEKIMGQESKALWFVNLIKKSNYTISMDGTYSEDKLKEIIDNASFGVTPSKNAKIVMHDDGFVIEPEVQGDIVDTQKVFEASKEAINSGVDEINLFDADCYKKPSIVSSDLQSKLDELNKVFNLEVKLDFDYTTENLTYDVFKDWVTIKKDGSYTIDQESVWEWVNSIRDKFDTLNKTRKFKSTLQGTVKIKAQRGADGKFDGIFGYFLDADKTAEAICKALKKGENTTIEPIYWTNGGYTYDTQGKVKRTANDEKDVINDISQLKTYIEVDLTNQMLWYYKNGKVKHKCGVVSGMPTKERMTYPGIYQLWMKERNKTMKGRTSEGSYESKCSYWNYISQNSIGIHDATWQSSFGGDRYKYYGSHGCVGISLSDAQYIYENIPLGTVVIMFY